MLIRKAEVKSHQSLQFSGRTEPRNDFFSDRRCFSANKRSLARRERFLFWRRILAISCSAAVFAWLSFASILSRRSLRAKKRLSAWERSFWHFTRIPVGRWWSMTQVEVLLTFCPPAPEERTNCSSMSCSRTPNASMRSSNCFSFSVETMQRATVVPVSDLHCTIKRPPNLGGNLNERQGSLPTLTRPAQTNISRSADNLSSAIDDARFFRAFT